MRVSLLQSQPSILSQFDASLAQSAVTNLLQTGVEVQTGVRVTEVTSTQVRHRVQCYLYQSAVLSIYLSIYLSVKNCPPAMH